MKKALFTLLTLGVIGSTNANNIQVSNVSLNGQNTASKFSKVNFDITWEHSWRTTNNETNYDGAWIFVKFRKTNSSLWEHATINYVTGGGAVASGHTQPTGSTLQSVTDSTGVFMYRAAAGTGTVNFTGTQLRWNYGSDGVLDNDSVELRVYAVEMVYCTQGQFSLGSGGTEVSFFKTGTTTNPYLVTSEAAITVGTATGNLNYGSSSYGGDLSGPIPATFPKGFNDFWIMKYEVSQQQYVDFLNAIDAAKAANRNMGFPGTPNNYVASFPERAANNISAVDHLAFLDWSALRPFTELEYEKACRGYNIAPIANEFAWGNTTVVASTSVNFSGLATETNGDGNSNYGGNINRPLRVGAYANDTTDTRTETGGSYYGALELSGNVWEQAVSVGAAAGRSFTGTHGDGDLNAAGEANAATWNAAAIGARGGGYQASSAYMPVSERSNAAYFGNTTRFAEWGCRGARTAD